jgi:pimeloyl-ACP methyl ester carboxylesterase
VLRQHSVEPGFQRGPAQRSTRAARLLGHGLRPATFFRKRRPSLAGSAPSLAVPVIAGDRSGGHPPEQEETMTAIDFDIRRLARRTDCLAWAASTRPGIRLLDLPGAHVRIRVAGRGARTLVFACDMPNVVESYDEIIRLLGDDYRILCWEQPGFGFSYPKPGFGFTLGDYAGVMAAMLEAAGMAPYTLVSPCVNVFQALLVADAHRALIERLVLMQAVRWPDMAAFGDWAMGRFALAGAYIPVFGKELARIPYVGQCLWAGMERGIARRTHPHVIHRAKERPERFHQISDPLYAAHDHGACACFASAYQNYYDPRATIPIASVPTLVLWASADRGHVHSDPKALLDYAPHGEWLEIADTGHHLELENPEAIASAIRRFRP